MSKFSKRLEGLLQGTGIADRRVPSRTITDRIAKHISTPFPFSFQSGIISKPKITKVESHISDRCS